MVPDLLFHGGTERRDRTVELLAPRDLLGLEGLILVDGQGILLALSLTGGNRNDVTQLMPLLAKIPSVPGLVGRPRLRPEEEAREGPSEVEGGLRSWRRTRRSRWTPLRPLTRPPSRPPPQRATRRPRQRGWPSCWGGGPRWGIVGRRAGSANCWSTGRPLPRVDGLRGRPSPQMDCARGWARESRRAFRTQVRKVGPSDAPPGPVCCPARTRSGSGPRPAQP